VSKLVYFQISPTYLESILLSHKSVSEAAVVGVPADVLGEVPRAYVDNFSADNDKHRLHR
jgi:acyl-coenzyme A synthetase/AMP-(fatty) acid ligase